ncbi:MAG: conjugal transfer protein TrbE [Desulfarculales bacterium]|nr:conjugal transfer protein TrbE [Desulfarculales bacterium]
MLALKDYRSNAVGLPDLLPYAALIKPGVVLNKDGSMLAAWEISGQDTASSTPGELSFVSAQFNNAVKLLGSGWMLHVDAIRSQERAYSEAHENHFTDKICKMIDDERREYFYGGKCYTTKTILAVTYKPGMLEKLHTFSNKNIANALEKNLAYFENSLMEMEDAFAAALRLWRLKELEEADEFGRAVLYSDLLSYIQHTIIGGQWPVRVPHTSMYLDALLGGEDLLGGIAPMLGSSYMLCLSLDGLPQESWPSMLSVFDTFKISFRFSSRFICLSPYEAIQEIKRYRKTWQQQIFRVVDQFFNNPSAKANRDAQLMTEDAEQVLTEVQSGYVGAGYLTSVIVLMNENQEILQDWSRDIRQAVQHLGIYCRVEKVNALEAWLGTLPGNYYANFRRNLVHTLNLSDLLPLQTIWAGQLYNSCPFYPPESPALMVCTTEGSTPFRFNLHVGDLGHTLVFGPTGSGKSTLLALIAAQFMRYQNAQVFAFDKGLSLYPLCAAAGGTHYHIGEDDFSFAPLTRIDESDSEAAWAEEWIASLCELQGLKVLPIHRNAIHSCVLSLKSSSGHLRSLSHVWHLVQNDEVRQSIFYYTQKGSMGRLLDAVDDNLGFCNFTVFEIEELMNLGAKNLTPVLMYLFRRIEKQLTGRPTLLLLDEAWIMLGNLVFRDQIREWLKVFRKANCAIVLATQSLSDAIRSGIMDVLIESCLTKILLPNLAARQDGQREYYQGMGLNARQIEIISSATPKRDYYVISPEGRRLVQLALQKKSLPFLGASDKQSISRINALRQSYPDNWPQHWLKEKGAL